MKFCANENIERHVVEMLRRTGHEVRWVVEDSPGVRDDLVLHHCKMRGQIVLTADKDFGELVYRRFAEMKGILLLRFRTPHPSIRAALLEQLLPRVVSLFPGRFVVVREGVIRSRPLPHTE